MLENQDDDKSFVEIFLELIDGVKSDISDHIDDKDEFAKEVIEYKQDFDGDFPGMLDDMTGVVEDFADDGGFGNPQNNYDLFDDMEDFSDGLWNRINEFPRLKELQRVTQPRIDRFMFDFKSKFPDVRFDDPNNNPWGVFHNFYDDTADVDPHQLGPLFDKEPVGDQRLYSMLYDKSHLETNMGRDSKFIFVREFSKFRNDELIRYKLILDNKIVEDFAKREDFSYYHGLPDQLRNDGVHGSLVFFVEEHINLMNYYIHYYHENEGLIVDIDHPQLDFPDGYSPEEFIDNLIDIIQNWEDNTYTTLKSWERKIRDNMVSL